MHFADPETAREQRGRRTCAPGSGHVQCPHPPPGPPSYNYKSQDTTPQGSMERVPLRPPPVSEGLRPPTLQQRSSGSRLSPLPIRVSAAHCRRAPRQQGGAVRPSAFPGCLQGQGEANRRPPSGDEASAGTAGQAPRAARRGAERAALVPPATGAPRRGERSRTALSISQTSAPNAQGRIGNHSSYQEPGESQLG